MAAANYQQTEEQFLCSICLEVFTHPVSTSCGHNFCKSCITQHWETSHSSQCPMCKEVFNPKPELQVNTLFSEVVSQFRAQQETSSSRSSSQQQGSKPGEIPCDVCTGPKRKALKSCLDCLASYCKTHLQPHLTAKRLKRHQLIDPVENLEDRMCLQHDKPLELFCKTDQTCVCMLCSVLDHKTHEFVPLNEVYEGKKAELGETEAEIQQMIQKRREKIQVIKLSADVSKIKADTEIAEGVRVLGALKASVERSQAELIQTIQEKQKKTEEQAQDFIKQLEEEISELEKRSSEVEQLSCSDDRLHLLHRVQDINQPPPTKDWTQVRVHPPSYEGAVLRAAVQLGETLREETEKLLQAELKRVQKYAVDVTLDPETAHPKLILSEDGKQVHLGNIKKDLPDNPERFDRCVGVLGKQSLSSGRFFYEVQVKGKTDWDLGLVRESINRKGNITLSPEDGFWCIWLRNENEYGAPDAPSVCLSLRSQPEKVGVFVDYEEGLVSFYDVDSADLIYSFSGCSFTEKLYPYFSPYVNANGINSAPLTISPVSGQKFLFNFKT